MQEGVLIGIYRSNSHKRACPYRRINAFLGKIVQEAIIHEVRHALLFEYKDTLVISDTGTHKFQLINRLNPTVT